MHAIFGALRWLYLEVFFGVVAGLEKQTCCRSTVRLGVT